MKFLQEFIATNLFKISFYNGLSLFVKLLAGFISSKAIAYFLGPSGLVLTANLRNLIFISEIIGLLGLQNAIVIEVAQNKENPEKLKSILQSLLVFFLGCTLGLSILIILFYSLIAQKLLLQEYSYIVFWAAFFIPFQVFSVFLIQILNGLQEFKKLYLTHIFGNIFYIIFSVILLWKLGLIGGLISVLVAPFILFCVVFYYYKPQFYLLISFKTIDYQIIKSLLPITGMILFTTIFSQITILEIRKTIVVISGINEAGYWEAMQRISSIYMLFFTSLITIYYLPKLSESILKIDKKKEYKALIKNFYIYLLPIVLIVFVFIYIFKLYIIQIVLNKEFENVQHFFLGQLIGDFFKIASSILALQFFIRKEIKPYLIFEAISLLLYLFLSYYFVKIYNGVGASFAFALSNMVYFFLVLIFRVIKFK